MSKFAFFLGLFLLVLPFLVWAGEYLYAKQIGATGERLMMAGFWGVLVGYYTVIPGFVLAVLGGLIWIFRD